MRLAVLALTLFATPSFASSSFEKFLGSIGSASLDGEAVEVPLYSGPTGSTLPHIQVQVGESHYLFGLLSAQKEVWVSERVAAAQGTKVKEQNKKLLNLCGSEPESRAYKHGLVIKTATLPELKVGGMTLADLSVLTSKRLDRKDVGQGGKVFYTRHDSGLKVDGYIGLESLPDDISWAILPSQGVVRFTKQAQAVEGGIVLSTSRSEINIEKWGKKAPFNLCQGAPVLIRDPQLMIPEGLTVGGIAMPAIIELGYKGSWYRWRPAMWSWTPRI